jgi:hypothetical protein
MVWSKFPTFTAGEDLLPKRRVKVKTGTTTVPPEVVYADAGEQHIGVTGNESTPDGDPVSIQPMNATGTYEGTASEAFVVPAVLYGAADGKIADTSSGSAIGIALEAATADGDIVQWISFAVLSTTAATVSYADASGFTTAATTEDALDELYQDTLSALNLIPVPVMGAMLSDGTNTVTFGGPSTDPVLDLTNGDTDSAIRWSWAAASVVAIIYQIPLPADIDVTADLLIYLMCGKDADANTVTLASDSYFDVGDTKVEDVTATIAAATAETLITIAASDIPAGAKTLTIELTPSAHAGDALYLYSVRPYYKSILKTS